MPPEHEWPAREIESIDVDASIQTLKEHSAPRGVHRPTQR